MSNESISAVFLGNFALLVGKEMICVLEKNGWMEEEEEEECVKQKERERERERDKFVFVSSHKCYLMS